MRRAAGGSPAVAMSIAASIAALVWRTSASADERAACIAASDDAQDLRSQHKLHAARDALLRCAQQTCPGVIRKDCAHWLAEVDDVLPSIVVKARDAAGKDVVEVRVLVDGVLLAERLDGQSLPLDPGVHRMRYELAGEQPVEETIVLGEGERGRVLAADFRLARPPAPEASQAAAAGHAPLSVAPAHEEAGDRTKRVASYVLGGAGALALTSFAYFGLTGRAQASALASGCGATKSCTHAQVDPVRAELLAADVSLGVGAVSLGAAVWLFLSSQSSAVKTAATLDVRVNPSPRGGSVEAIWAF